MVICSTVLHILVFGNMEKVICNNCHWTWNTESKDKNPFLCHRCGFDNKLNMFDILSFNKWKKDNPTLILPYKEQIIDSNTYIRTFDENIDPIELTWHRDNEDRIIESLNTTDWMIQFDNELPIKIEGKIHINKHQYHRLIKGTKELKIKLIKMY